MTSAMIYQMVLLEKFLSASQLTFQVASFSVSVPCYLLMVDPNGNLETQMKFFLEVANKIVDSDSA